METVELAIPLDAVLLNNADPKTVMTKCVNRVNSMIMRIQVEQSRSEKILSFVLMILCFGGLVYLLYRIGKIRLASKDTRDGSLNCDRSLVLLRGFCSFWDKKSHSDFKVSSECGISPPSSELSV